MKYNYYPTVQVKKSILTTIFILMCGLSAHAAENYGFKIGGVPVTSSNCNNVTGDNITSGTVKYNKSTNTVTLTNVTINRTSSDGRCIFNEENDGLIVELRGTNTLTSKVCSPVKLQTTTTFIAAAGSKTTMKGLESEANGIYIDSNRGFNVYFKGTGTIDIISGNDAAFWRDGSYNASNRAKAYFMGPKVNIEGKKGDLSNVDAIVNYIDGTGTVPKSVLTLKATNNQSYPNVINSVVTLAGNPQAAILEPWGAYVSGTTIKVNNPVYTQNIVISSDYVALLTAQYFPDVNFRNRLTDLYPKGYLTESDVSNRKTLYATSMNIKSLTGIEYFTELTSLYLYNNPGLESLNLTKNKKLTTIDCSSCGLISLNVRELISLIYLDCSDNSISNLDLSTNTQLETLKAPNNDFSFINLSYNPKLKTLNCAGCTKLLTLSCRQQSLTSLNVSGCNALKTLECGHNPITSLDVSNLPSLQTLDCTSNTQMTSLNCDNCALEALHITSCTALTSVSCQNNKLTSLNISNYPNLTSLNCKGNAELRSLYCMNNALTTLNVEGCSALKQIYAGSNNFTELTIKNLYYLQSVNVSNNPSMTKLDCIHNISLTSLNMTGCTGLKELNCSHNNLTSLDVSWLTNLNDFNCSYNNLTSLDLSGLTKLQVVQCQYNSLTSLDVSGLTNLYYLSCNDNSLESLDVSGLTNLETLSCRNNSLKSLDVSGLTNLEDLYCYDNSLESLDVSGLTNLEDLYCSDNSLESLNVSGLTNLKHLSCHNNGLKSLDVSGLTNLSELACNDNSLESLNVSGLKMYEFYCQNNSLETLNLDNCTVSHILDCSNNNLSTLNMEKMCGIFPYSINCSKNRLTSITLPKDNANMQSLDCYSNCLNDQATRSLIEALLYRSYDNMEGYLFIMNLGDENEQNVVTTSSVELANSKYWAVFYTMDESNWYYYEGSTPTPTDVPAVATPSSDAPAYNLSGQRVNEGYKGIVIQNGRKIKR